MHANLSAHEPAPGSTIITALDRAWHAIQARHSDVSNALILIGSGRAGRRVTEKLGHHWAERWSTPQSEARTAEVFIAGELLARGGATVLQTLLHEAAHAVAYIRDIKDCSRSGNRYHNRRFAELAAELGLTPPTKPAAVRGYSNCTLGSATAATYAATIEALSAAAVAHLGNADADRPATGRAGRRLAVSCNCGRRLQISPRCHEDGPIICGRCGEQFQPRER